MFRILGPLEVVGPEGPVRLGGPRQRSVLAILLLDANRVVSIDRLADELYGEAPPVSAVTQVHRQISELRALLGPKAPSGRGTAVIETQPPGYRVVVAPGGLDLHVFEQRVEEAGRAFAAGTPDLAVGLYRQALALWRGAPLADLAFEPFARPVIERLSELRLTVLERCLESELAAGRGPELVPELEQLVAENPLDERLRGHLMVALYRAGRQADALRTFREGRAALVEAFGLEPTPALKQLEARVLRQDPDLDAAPSAPGVGTEDVRTVLLAAQSGEGLAALVVVGRHLAARGRQELLVTQVVEREEQLADAVVGTRAWRDALAGEGVMSRAAAFVSRSVSADLASLARTHDANVLVAEAPPGLAAGGLVPEALADLLESSPCDVAVLTGTSAPVVEEGVAVLFGGGAHDWAAAELGAWLVAGSGATLRLVGVRGGRLDQDGDASRLLATASIAIQRVVGVDVEPALADPGAAGLLAATESAGVVVVGLSARWRREGLGDARGALVSRGSPTLVVHRGARPGGLAPRETLTRFTWTLAAGG